MTDMGFAAPVAPALTVVVADTPCRKCQYNLRSLSVQGLCPECGTPVGLSVLGDLLRYSDPEWLHKLRTGVNLIIAAVLFSILGAVLGAILSFRLHTTLPPVMSGLMTGVLYFLGGWFLTMPDPSGLGEDKYGTSRQIIRISLLIGIAGNLIGFAQQTHGIPPVVRSFLTLSTALIGIISVVAQFATLNYLGKLAVRIPDDQIAARAHFLMYAFGISYGILALFGLFALLVGRMGGTSMAGPAVGLGCVAALAGVALIVFGIMYLFMLGRLGNRFKVAELLAIQTWSSARS
jgi:hypothetical protein